MLPSLRPKTTVLIELRSFLSPGGGELRFFMVILMLLTANCKTPSPAEPQPFRAIAADAGRPAYAGARASQSVGKPDPHLQPSADFSEDQIMIPRHPPSNADQVSVPAQSRLLSISHERFATIPARWDQPPHSYHYQLTLVSSMAAWQELTQNLPLVPGGKPTIDFSRSALLVLLHSFNRGGYSIAISQVRAHNKLLVNLIKKSPASYCYTAASERGVTLMHSVAIPKDELGADYEQHLLNTAPTPHLAAESEACLPPPFTISTSLPKLKTSSFAAEVNAANPSSSVVLAAFSGTWGEWELFQRHQCPSCLPSPPPFGYPEEFLLLALVDETTPYPRQGSSHLKIKGLYLYEDHIFVDAVREVINCPNHTFTAGFQILKVGRSQLKGHLPAHKMTFRLPWPFIPEIQLPCQTSSSAQP